MRKNVLLSFLCTTTLGAFAAGCADEPDPGTAPGGSTEETGTLETTGDGNSQSGGGTTIQPETASGEDESEDDDSSAPGFIVQPEIPAIDVACDVWTQDCPRGEKCMPWANDGGGAWNATKCTALDAAPAQPGDECRVEGSGTSGIDTCDVSAMCWDVDGKTNLGTCVAFCVGSADNPVCDDPTSSCSIANGGTLILCLPKCDPLLQDCTDGQACYGIDNSFVCAPDASGPTLGVYGDACEFINACDPGLGCFAAAGVPGCQGTSCCTTFCDVEDPTSAESCAGRAEGQDCVAYFPKGDAPPGYEAVGVCLIPE